MRNESLWYGLLEKLIDQSVHDFSDVTDKALPMTYVRNILFSILIYVVLRQFFRLENTIMFS